MRSDVVAGSAPSDAASRRTRSPSLVLLAVATAIGSMGLGYRGLSALAGLTAALSLLVPAGLNSSNQARFRREYKT